MFLLYIDASSIINGKGRGTGADSASVGIEFKLKDYYGIQVRPVAALIWYAAHPLKYSRKKYVLNT